MRNVATDCLQGGDLRACGLRLVYFGFGGRVNAAYADKIGQPGPISVRRSIQKRYPRVDRGCVDYVRAIFLASTLIIASSAYAADAQQKTQPPETQNARQNPYRDSPVRDIIDQGVEAQKKTLASQQRIDKTAQETAELTVRYKNSLREIDGLRTYNAQLERQIANQESEIENLTLAASRVTDMERQLVPLMTRMVESLAQFVELDLPFRLAERRAEIQKLRSLLDNPSAVVSEKFRAVINAYERESAWGRSFTSYEDSIRLNNTVHNVRILQVGRVALIAQARDRKLSALWNPERRAWDVLDSAFAEGIEEAILVARGERPAEKLLPLPLRVPASVASQGGAK